MPAPIDELERQARELWLRVLLRYYHEYPEDFAIKAANDAYAAFMARFNP